MKRKALAVWNGGLKEGTGALGVDSRALNDTPYSFGARFENDPGTNPEELIAAAHAGCFAMALSGQLESAGLKARDIRTTATLTLEAGGNGPEITAIHLDVTAKVPGASQTAFEAAAEKAKIGCPVSKVLRADITMDAKLQA